MISPFSKVAGSQIVIARTIEEQIWILDESDGFNKRRVAVRLILI